MTFGLNPQDYIYLGGQFVAAYCLGFGIGFFIVTLKRGNQSAITSLN
jgi:hypothetical protein